VIQFVKRLYLYQESVHIDNRGYCPKRGVILPPLLGALRDAVN